MSDVHRASPSIRCWPSWIALAAALGSATGCGRDPQPAPALQLLDMRPRERSNVYLNEHLVLHFSAELEGSSVTPQSFRITTSDGVPARGTRFVTGRELRFVPDPVRAPNLRDGGYLPDTGYRVELAGFPRADTLRGSDGACLQRTLRIDFHTVSADDRQGGLVFEDDSPDQGLGLSVLRTRPAPKGLIQVSITPQGGLELEAEEPIDPSSLSMEDFDLIPLQATPARKQYPLRPVLVENHNKHAFPSLGTTRLSLVPQTVLPRGEYRLRFNPRGTRLRDFSRKLMPLKGLGPDGLRRLLVVVEELPVPGEYWEEFLDTSMRSSALVPGSDGTATWSDSGRVELRFPAAAGDGSDGDVRLGSVESRASIHAARLSVLEETLARLECGEGLCVLRSQGALEIAGRLERSGTPHSGPLPACEPGETLSHWLERQAASGASLTVLIAGGDLRITGHVQVPGPLLLVAGGRVRVSGRVRACGAKDIGPSFFNGKGEGGVIAVWNGAQEGEGQSAKVEDLPLGLDPPLFNPLVRPLSFAVRSNPIPAQGRALRWLNSEGLQGREGDGTLRVSYAGERRTADGQGDLEVLVDDPALLVDCPTLRLVLELGMPVAARAPGDPPTPWNPPMLDSVRVRWETEGDQER